MDDLDRRIVQQLQDHFPLEVNPYEAIAKTLDLDVNELWRRVSVLIESGAIRRIGCSIDSRAFGFASTLAAIRVPNEQVDAVSKVIEGIEQITHSYLRDADFNIWFTVIARSEAEIASILNELREKLGIAEADLMNLPMKKLYKLDARFK